MQFPACYEEPVVRMVHHALAKPDEIVTRLLAHFKERLVPGEEAIALRSGTPAACVVAQCLGPDGLDAGQSPPSCPSLPKQVQRLEATHYGGYGTT